MNKGNEIKSPPTLYVYKQCPAKVEQIFTSARNSSIERKGKFQF